MNKKKSDTPPHIEELYRKLIMEKTPEERFMMGVGLNALARDMVIASFPKDITVEEKRILLFERYYGHEFSGEKKKKIIAFLGSPLQKQKVDLNLEKKPE